MTFDISATRAQLKTLLSTLVGSGQPLAYVYDFANPNIEGYPAVLFDVTNENANTLDDTNNIREITFTIWITQEIQGNGQETAKDILDNAVNQVINILEKKANWTLGNTVDWTIPVVGSRKQYQSPEGLVMVQEIILKTNIASSLL